MTAMPETITVDQINAALRALGFDLTAADLCTITIAPRRVTIEGYARDAEGMLITSWPYSDLSAKWCAKVPIVSAP